MKAVTNIIVNIAANMIGQAVNVETFKSHSYISTFVLFQFQTLFEFKYDFLTKVSEHEHYIPLSLPLMRKGMIKTFKGMYLSQYKIVVAS